MHAIVPTPFQVALQEKRIDPLLLDQLPRFHAEPLGQNSSQSGLAVVKMCGLHRGTFMGRNTAGVTPPRLEHPASAKCSPQTVPGGHAMQTQTSTTTMSSALQVKTHVKTGGLYVNHNETLVQASRPTGGLRVKTHIKAGFNPQPDPPG